MPTHWKTIDEVNTSEGMQTLFTYSAEVVPILPALILFSFFMIVFLGSYFYQVRQRGIGNLAGSFAVAGFLSSLVALAMSLLPGFINLPTLVTTFAVAILGFIWLVFSERD